ncbi:ATP-dependent DNA helicase [Synechococcus sp. A15-24]|nr:ATP-dependent DNA helicase [Synechococcus sp. A15-24]
MVAPADPLLMSYARSWSVAEPYVLSSQDSGQAPIGDSPVRGRGPSLPLEAVNDGAGAMIRLKTPQLPSFLQR